MSDNVLTIRPASETRWDGASFGEVMLRFDPGFGRAAMRGSFTSGKAAASTTSPARCANAGAAAALPVNDPGWLVEDLICQGGVDMSHAPGFVTDTGLEGGARMTRCDSRHHGADDATGRRSSEGHRRSRPIALEAAPGR